jgi:hypothetical protein
LPDSVAKYSRKERSANAATTPPAQLTPPTSSTPTPTASTAKIVEVVDAWCTTTSALTASAGSIIFDSGATNHMTPAQEVLSNLKTVSPIQINAAGSTSFQGIGQGTMTLALTNNIGKSTTIALTNTIYAPTMAHTLILLSRLESDGFKITLANASMKIATQKGYTIGIIPRIGGLYWLSIPFSASAMSATPPLLEITLEDLHKCLGHCSYKALKRMVQSGRFPNLKPINNIRPQCRICELAKANCAPIAHIQSSPLASSYGDHTHSDVWGPATVQTPFHKKYALILLDNATWWITAPLMRHKSDALSRFVGHLLRKRAQYNITPKIFQSNRGGEFTSADFSAYLESHGIICKLTVHDTPKHNGAAEQAWRTLLNIVRTLLFASNLPQKLWGEALQHAIYVYNRSPHSILGGRSPYEARFKTTPNLSNLWEFGSWVFVHITTNDKLAPQAAECRWIGFNPSSNGHRIYWTD